jgi:hypothetical protein
MNQVFISHSNSDKDFACKLAQLLKEEGLNVFLDEWKIGIGERIAKKLGEAIIGSNFFILIASPDSMISNWVETELDTAINLGVRGKLSILVVMYKHCEIHPLLTGKLYIEYKGSVGEVAKALLDAMQPSIIKQFGRHRVVNFASNGGSANFSVSESGVSQYDIVFKIPRKGSYAGIFWEPLSGSFNAKNYDTLTWQMCGKSQGSRFQIKIETKTEWHEKRIPFKKKSGWNTYSIDLLKLKEGDLARIERITIAMDDTDCGRGVSKQEFSIRSFNFSRLKK